MNTVVSIIMAGHCILLILKGEPPNLPKGKSSGNTWKVLIGFSLKRRGIMQLGMESINVRLFQAVYTQKQKKKKR